MLLLVLPLDWDVRASGVAASHPLRAQRGLGSVPSAPTAAQTQRAKLMCHHHFMLSSRDSSVGRAAD